MTTKYYMLQTDNDLKPDLQKEMNVAEDGINKNTAE